MKFQLNNKTLYCFLICALNITFVATTAQAESALNKNFKEQARSQKKSVKSQHKIDQLSVKSADLLNQYQHIIDQVETLKIYNQQLEKLVHSQETEKQLKNKQLNSIEGTEQKIVPLMLSMINVLEQFINKDIPFLKPQRLTRVNTLKKMMDKADITTSEKYHQILQSFLQEINYGQTIESYQAILSGKKNSQVKFLRIGRIALYYQTLDQSKAYHWSTTQRQFVPLEKKFFQALERGFKVALKQAAPEFLKLPLTIQNPTHEN